MIFWEFGSRGFSRYSFIIIFECSSQSFHASFETFSYTRLPSSPVHGMRSRPGISFPNFTQWTIRVPGLTGSLVTGSGPQESLAILFSSEDCHFHLTATGANFLVRFAWFWIRSLPRL